MDVKPLETGSDYLLAEAEGAVGRITFNNPARHNAMKLEMWQALARIIARIGQEDQIRVVTLRGAGDAAFVSGADISEFESHRATPAKVEAYENHVDAAQEALAALPKPTIAVIDGFCIGGGLGIALACDMRLASLYATFGIPAARLGLGYRMTGIKKLLDVVGAAHAREIFMTAKRFDAEQAQSMGLVNWALPQTELEDLVGDYCRRIAENAPLTMASVKSIINTLSKPPADIDRDHCDALVRACFESDDYVEGRRAFMEKRKPIFKGS